MSKPILTRVLAVSYLRDPAGNEGVQYRPGPLSIEGPAPRPVFRPIAGWDNVRAAIDQVQAHIDDLIRRALVGQQRDPANRLETAIQNLAHSILPEAGLCGLVPPGTHPQFDIVGDASAEIPWEVLEETYRVCPECGRHTLPHPRQDEPQAGYCSVHGCELEPAGGKVALTYHLTHLPRGEGRTSAAGKEFLVIEDPTGDLCAPDRDPKRICREHLRKIRALLEERGYVVNPLPGNLATRDQVRAAIANPNLAGIYYFGHGHFPKGGDEGRLLLAGNTTLSAREIEEAAPAARFVFLNACEGAKGTAAWGFEKRSGSVAEAFAGGGRKVVIAPLWPVVNTQAAETALEFFQNASPDTPLAEALHAARADSLRRYEAQEPHISWMAYRYFGDPNKPLPAPAEAAPRVVPGARAALPCRVFDDDDKLNMDLFAFGMDSALLRAAKRRNLQNRSRVSFTDLVAGMMRKGDLTRFVLRRLGIDPDKLYDTLGETEEFDPGNDPEETARDRAARIAGDDAEEVGPEEKLRRFLAEFIVRDRDEFDDPVIETLEHADRLAQEAAETDPDARITERDLLRALAGADEWETVGGLPESDDLLRDVDESQESGTVDANGRLVLAGLDPRARKVIETAHVLAQQRGVYPITHRLFLAALLSDRKGVPARIFRAAHVKPQLIFILMLAASEEKPSRSFGLSPEACGRIILPVIEAARRLAPDPENITDADLFRAFCHRAAPRFKRVMKKPPLAFDLDAMATLEPAPEGEGEDEQDDDDKVPPADRPTAFELTAEEGVAEVIRAASFEDAAWDIILEAADVAWSQGHRTVRSPNLFAAMIGDGSGPAAAALERSGLDPRQVKHLVLALIPERPPPPGPRPKQSLSKRTHGALKRAIETARAEGREQATPDDLLGAFFAEGGGVVGELLRQAAGQAPVFVVPGAGRGAAPAGPPEVLPALGEDLTEKARSGRLPRIVGRDAEIKMAMQTLLLRENANPLLVGEAGVGKTAIVEGIAQRIADGQCPARLRPMRLVEISAGSLVASTRLRGEFEERVQQVLAEARGDVILFIDEIHTIVGAGSAGTASLDAGNMLKSALARGEVRLIGATTPSEYRRTIARDRALSRRFQTQMIGPPSREATIAVLAAWRENLSEHHGVRVTEEAERAATDLSGRYIVDKQWPAKARDVLDRACALATFDAASADARPTVSPEHVADVVSKLTGIPLERVSPVEQNLLAGLEDRIGQRIIGQAHAVKQVAETIRRGRQGLQGENRPWGVFLFVGPPGVGKTELAKVLAEEVYGGAEGLTRFDMGDFTEPHSTAKLLGAPPSYVGYGEGAPLVERLRRHPYSLLLFDEIEHAHEDVLAVLLRLLSEGTVEDAEGNLGDARNCIVILTTNAVDTQQLGPMGFARGAEADGPSQAELRGQLERLLSAKFVDRIDAVVNFRLLSEDDLAAIARQKIEQVVQRAERIYGVSVTVAPEVFLWVAQKVATERAGARGIQRAADAHVGVPLGDYLARPAARQSGTARVALTEDAIAVTES